MNAEALASEKTGTCPRQCLSFSCWLGRSLPLIDCEKEHGSYFWLSRVNAHNYKQRTRVLTCSFRHHRKESDGSRTDSECMNV